MGGNGAKSKNLGKNWRKYAKNMGGGGAMG